jgi:hypothetical protein
VDISILITKVAVINVKRKETETLSKCKEQEIRGQQDVKIEDKNFASFKECIRKFFVLY